MTRRETRDIEGRQTTQTLILKLTKKSGMRDVMLSKSL